MNNIHVCLVSDQPIPNLTSALQFRPDTVLLLYTEVIKAKEFDRTQFFRNYPRCISLL